MNEITRIHLAKTPYEIEVKAKKDLELYLKKLEVSVADLDIINDIEIRITEILSEQGVRPGDVISSSDVAVVSAQIGTPEEIADGADIDAEIVDQDSARKLYRDTDRGLLGGVVSGLSAYLKVDLSLARVVFIVLTFITSGFMVLVYGLMWFIVPAAKTASEKLRLRGNQVTVDSIAAINQEDVADSRRRGKLVRGVLLYMTGIAAVIGAVASLLTVLAASASIYSEGLFDRFDEQYVVIAFGLAVFSGLLLALLCSLVAVVCFRRDISKRMLSAITVVIIAGIISFSTAAGIGILGIRQSESDMRANTKTSQLDIPAEFSSIDSLSFSSSIPASLEYVVSDQPRVTLQSASGVSHDIEVDDGSAKISLSSKAGVKHFGYNESIVRVYGPALSQVTVYKGNLNYQAESQKLLKIEISTGATGQVGGAVDQLEAVTQPDSSLYLDGASIGDAMLDIGKGSDIQLGNIRNIDVTYSDVCPVGDQKSVLEVSNIASNKLSINGQAKPVQSYDLPCLDLNFNFSAQ